MMRLGVVRYDTDEEVLLVQSTVLAHFPLEFSTFGCCGRDVGGGGDDLGSPTAYAVVGRLIWDTIAVACLRSWYDAIVADPEVADCRRWQTLLSPHPMITMRG